MVTVEHPLLPIPGLYRSWKGHVVNVEGPCRSATGEHGVVYTFMSGLRTGRREWRSLSDWNQRPIGPSGPPRFRRLSTLSQTVPDTISEVLTVFSGIWPDAQADVCCIAEHDTPGACYPAEADGAARVVIRADLTLAEAIEVLLHELAHVVSLDEVEHHGPLFYRQLHTLQEAWGKRVTELGKIPGLRIFRPNKEKETICQ